TDALLDHIADTTSPTRYPSHLSNTLLLFLFFFFNDPPTTEIYTLSLHDALPILSTRAPKPPRISPPAIRRPPRRPAPAAVAGWRSEEHTSELQSRGHLVCRLLLEKKKTQKNLLMPTRPATHHPCLTRQRAHAYKN